ncbi:MAG: DUF1844 domain-containing protein [Vicinamibacterales bacterium]
MTGDESSDQQASAITFAGFVLSLAHTTAVHLGDVPDPVSGAQGEVRLEPAFQMIEILGLLEEKTRGNLTAEERQLLEQIVYELRMRFMEVQKAQTAPQSRIIIP